MSNFNFVESDNLSEAVGLSSFDTLNRTVYDWFVGEGDSVAYLIERILNHESLSSDEKLMAMYFLGSYHAQGRLIKRLHSILPPVMFHTVTEKLKELETGKEAM